MLPYITGTAPSGALRYDKMPPKCTDRAQPPRGYYAGAGRKVDLNVQFYTKMQAKLSRCLAGKI